MNLNAMDSTKTLLERRKRLLGSAYRLFYDEPVHLVRGEGVWLYDAGGRQYLDVYNNVPHVGHCHPHVVEAIHRQAQTLNTHTRYLHSTVLDYAEHLSARFPAGLDITMFACTGTEANELALRLARAATGNTGMIVTEHAYHGNSWAVAQITSCYTKADKRGDNIVTVPIPDMFRGSHAGDPAAADKYAAHIREATETLARNGHRPAALIVDTVFANEGLPDVPRGYLEKAVDIVRQAGGLFVADEVQPGFGRLGTHFWGFQRHGVVPDIVTLGKPMANGYPVSAVVTTKSITDAFSREAHYFNTFAGTPVACAAAQAVLEVIETQDLVAKALKTGDYLMAKLKVLAKDNDMIGDVRGSGLFIGVELVHGHDQPDPATSDTARIVNLLRKRGVLISSTGLHDNVLKIRPPMVFAEQHADLLVHELAGSLAELRAAAGRRI